MRILYNKEINISLKKIIHNKKQCYINSNYGGEKIKDWPFYKFLKIYIYDSEANALSLWTDWLKNEYRKYCLIEKKNGGMLNGSIHKIVCSNDGLDKKYYLEHPDKIDNDTLIKSCEIYVKNKFKLVESIKTKGFIFSKKNKIFANYYNNNYELYSGHHRIAILELLNYKSIDELWVYTLLYKLLKKI